MSHYLPEHCWIQPVIIPGKYGVRTAERDYTVNIGQLASIIFRTWRKV